MLEVIQAEEVHKKAGAELWTAQQNVGTAYTHLSELRDKAIALWKKDCQPSGPTYGHILMPDGRLLCLKEGSITIWELTKL